ncbi:hypothetical protein N199_03460 [Helicobacter pylori UM038]|uniref:Uncharacterized protein n=1 Tax=Helicobacter pylori UM038 TaxID=1352343 RepID=A0AAV3JPZ8_HELPX|nr:hypothetical protein N199_03460 [Helicobacter pylori UM038]
MKTMGVFKSYEIIVCCLITPLTFQEESGFETNFMGAMVGLEAREQVRSRFFSLTLSGRRNP